MKRLEVRAKANDVYEIMLYGVVGGGFWEDGVTASQFRKELKAVPKSATLNLRINSPGGSTIEAAAIMAALDEHPGRVEVDVDGLAASAASVVAMAGDEVRMGPGALMMVHNPWAGVQGGAEDMRKFADLLDKVRGTMLDAYERRSRKGRDQIAAWMDAETWFTGAEAVEAGLADSASAGRAVAACAGLERFGYARIPQAATAAWAEHERRKEIAARL